MLLLFRLYWVSEMRTLKLKFFSLILILFCLNFACLSLPPKAAAQSLSLSLSPPLLEVIIKPGKSVTQVYKIVNNGETTITQVKLVEFEAAGVKENPDFVRENWLSLLNQDLALDQPFLFATGQSRQIVLRINPPAGTKEQDYYRALVISTKPNPEADTSQSSLSQSLVSPILISVTSTGMLSKSARITKFNLPKFIDSFTPLESDIEVGNTGKAYFRPVGKIDLVGNFGKGSYPLTTNIILAGQTKKLLTEHSASSFFPKTLFLSGFFLGKYEFSVDFTLDEGTTRINSIKTFYAFPFKAVSVLLLGFIIIYFLKRKRRSARKRRDET